ncbi:MAG: methyltransferase [Oscillospiraceae bacterium]|nr:methyltransferase [Oscillospiraceae bacterium]
MPEFTELWAGGPVFAQAEHFRLGTDSVLLADFVNTSGAARGVDLGCASGAIALLLLARSPALHMTGLELLPDAAALARENLEKNGLADRGEIIAGDIRRHRALFRAGSFDLVAANPPYYPAGSGSLPRDGGRAAARGETACSLDDVCAAAAFLCRTGGSFSLVYKPERLSELLCAMSAHAIEPKRLRLVCNRAGDAPGLVLVEGRRGGKPGLRIEPELVLTAAGGGESAEFRRIYHR